MGATGTPGHHMCSQLLGSVACMAVSSLCELSCTRLHRRSSHAAPVVCEAAHCMATRGAAASQAGA